MHAAQPYLLPAVHRFSVRIRYSDTERRHENRYSRRINSGPNKKIADLTFKQGIRGAVTEVSIYDAAALLEQGSRL
jgi:hypothetical protein